MIEQHAQKYIDRVDFGTTGTYKVVQGKYTRQMYYKMSPNFRDWQKAEDIVQEAYLDVLTNPPPPMSDKEFEKYFTRICSNKLYDSYRNDHQKDVHGMHPHKEYLELSRWDEEDGGFVMLEDVGNNPEDVRIDKETRALIKALIEKKKSHHRQPLAMIFLYEYTNQEVATVTGMPVETVRTLQKRFRKVLREELV